jgi:hypothetical protein
VVRVTDSVPGLPLRVPNELAHLFATTHNNVQLFPLPVGDLWRRMMHLLTHIAELRTSRVPDHLQHGRVVVVVVFNHEARLVELHPTHPGTAHTLVLMGSQPR